MKMQIGVTVASNRHCLSISTWKNYEAEEAVGKPEVVDILKIQTLNLESIATVKNQKRK